MTVHWGGRGPGHMSRRATLGLTWGDFTASAGFVESPDNTFTRNTANSWTPRVTSNSAYAGPVRVEGVWIFGNDVAFGLDDDRAVTPTYQQDYAWYFTPTNAATKTLGGAGRVNAGDPVSGDVYGIRKSWNGSAWLIEWYRTRSGTTTVLDSLTTATDQTLGVLAGAFTNGASFSLLGISA